MVFLSFLNGQIDRGQNGLFHFRFYLMCVEANLIKFVTVENIGKRCLNRAASINSLSIICFSTFFARTLKTIQLMVQLIEHIVLSCYAKMLASIELKQQKFTIGKAWRYRNTNVNVRINKMISQNKSLIRDQSNRNGCCDSYTQGGEYVHYVYV